MKYMKWPKYFAFHVQFFGGKMPNGGTLGGNNARIRTEIPISLNLSICPKNPVYECTYIQLGNKRIEHSIERM